MRKYQLHFLFFLTTSFFVLSIDMKAQVDSIPEQVLQLIESVIEDEGGDIENFEYNTLLETLEYYRLRPLNLNKASFDELGELSLLTDLQIADLINHRLNFGDLLSLHELQVISSFDLNTIYGIANFVAVDGNIDDFQVNLGKMLVNGKNEFLVNYGRTLEKKRGYIDGEFDDPYLGSPFRLFTRFVHRYENRLSYGITAEKDAGEEFFEGSNEHGFDFYSAHFFIDKLNSRIKTLALGDYQIALGQGLIARAGFGYGKSINVMDIRRSSPVLRPQRSANEVDFFRGAATTIGLTDQIDLTAFYSFRKRDANVLSIDTVDFNIPENDLGFSSFQTSGLHRYKAEIEDENQVDVHSYGGRIKYKKDRIQIAVNTIAQQFDQEFNRDLKPYNQFEFSDEKIYNLSVDYSYIFRNFHIFGETAIDHQSNIATLNGLLIGLDRRVDFSILHRHYPRDFQSLNARPFGETTSTGGRNEAGLYLGLEVRPSRRFKLQVYHDLWKHEWLRFSIDAPSTGNESFVQVTYSIRRKLDLYLRYRTENKQRNVISDFGRKNVLYDQNRTSFRLHLGFKPHKSIELRSRLEAVRYRLDNPARNAPLISVNLLDGESVTSDIPGLLTHGFLLYQDILYKPIAIPIVLTTRFAIFDTDDYNSRIYAYENNLAYTFTVPAYYYTGTRAYLNLRFTGIKNWSLEARIAQTYIAGQEANIDFIGFGSGREEILGRTRTDVRFQVRYKF